MKSMIWMSMLIEWKELFQGILKFMETYKKEFKALKSICRRKKKLTKMFVAHSISEIFIYYLFLLIKFII